MWFGCKGMPDNDSITVIQGDVRDAALFAKTCEGKDAVIYLAGITSDEMCQRNPLLHDYVNRDVFPRVIAAARVAGVKRFIYASSVAAYGSSDEDAKETRELEPSTLYGHAKKHGEAWVLAHQQSDFTTTITRCASVCGPAPRQRFDITVNRMVYDAELHGVITVNGGQQKRSHIHISDVCDFYTMLLDAPAKKVAGQVFNVVGENSTVMETARKVADIIGSRIVTKDRTDNRSYTVDGTKAKEVLGFVPKRSVTEAIRDLHARFESDATGTTKQYQNLLTDQRYMNLADGLA